MFDFAKSDIGPIAGEPGLLDEQLLADDARKLVIWYNHHGWFDARFVEWKRKPRRRERTAEGALRIDLTGVVEPGQPSLLDAPVELVGIEALSAPLAEGLRKLVELREGDRFDLDAYEASVAAIRDRLRERGYAYAQVQGHVVVQPAAHTVAVRIALDTGRPCVFGEIRLKGELGAPEARLLQETGLNAGEGFRTSKLAEARQKLYALGVFTLVDVTPVLKTPAAREVPIEIRLQRRPSRQFQLGPQLRVEPGRQEVSVAVAYSDDDVFKRLLRWNTSLSGGAATAVDPTQEATLAEQADATAAPTAELKSTFTIPGLLGGKFAVATTAGALLGVEPGYREQEVSGNPTLVWTPDRRIVASLGYRLKFHRYLDVADRIAIESTDLHVSLEKKGYLSILEQSLVWDARDSKLAPTRNYYAAVAFGEAGGPFGGDRDFFRTTGEIRSYRHLRFGDADPSTVIAGRLGAGVILPYAGATEVDVDERLYLGGGTSVRGWGEKRLGPYVNLYEPARDDAGWAVKSGEEPVGGNLSLLANAEVRQRLPWSLSAVAFCDVGRVWDLPQKFSWDELQVSVGGGLRYSTPIGPIRFDVGVRLGDPEYFLSQPQVAYHLGLGEAF
jgi:outer membrane protein assembly factor BamA